MEKGNESGFFLFLIFVFSAFVGAYFSLPGISYLFLFRIMMIFILVHYLFNVMRNGKIVYNKSIRIFYLIPFVWIGYSIITILWSNDKLSNIMYNYFVFEATFIIIVFTLYVNSEEKLDKIYRLLYYIFLFNLLIGFFEIITGKHLKVIPEMYKGTWLEFAPFSFFDNVNDFASYLTLYLPFVLIYFIKNKKSIVLFIGILLTTVYLVIRTSSEVNILICAMQIFIYYFILRKHLKLDRLFFLPEILVGIIVILMIRLSNIAILDEFKDALAAFSDFLNASEGSLYIRRELIIEGLTIAYNSAFLGVGAGNAQHHLMNSKITQSTDIVQLHNWVIEVLSNYGVFMLILMVVFYLYLLKKLITIYVATKDLNVLLVIVSCLTFAINSVSPSSILQLRYFWIIIGIALCVIQIQSNKKRIEQNENHSFY